MKNKTKLMNSKKSFARSLFFVLSLFILGCNKEELIPHDGDIPENVKYESVMDIILAMGYDSEDIEEYDDFYLVEGDIMFPRDLSFYQQNQGGTKQLQSASLVSLTNVASMAVFVDASIPTSGTDNWRSAVSLAINDWNGITCTKVFFTEATSIATADIVVKSDNGTLNDGVLASAGFPSSNQPFNQVLVNLNSLSNMTILEGQKRYIMVHELGHCIGFHHTDGGAGIHITGTAIVDPQSVMNAGASTIPSWSSFSTNDMKAVQILYPCPDMWIYSSAGVSSWLRLSSSPEPLDDLRFGDFNGDEKTDVFAKIGSQWKYSSAGVSSWINLSSAPVSIDDLRFGDFNGDGKTDVFAKIGNQWTYSSGGVSSWINIASSNVALEDLRFGDFDGDNKTDVFTKMGSQWKYSSGGVSSWINLASSTIALDDLRFGDFNGDGKTDVFVKIGSQWKYSSGGVSSWINLSSAPTPLSDLKFGDFNGDGKTDVFAKVGNDWRYSSGGVSSWISLSSSTVDIDDLKLGDFNGDGKTDIFTQCDP